VTIRVLIVEDHPVFASGLVSLLGVQEGIEVVGSVFDAPDSLGTTRAVADVVVMDLNLPSMSGVEATALLAAAEDAPAILVLTMVDDDQMVLGALRAGARGYVLKGSSGEEIVSAVRTVATGGAVFGAGVAAQVLSMTTGTRPAGRDGLTDRERQVLVLLADGSSNAAIARSLGLSLKTVQNYVSRILDKLQVSDRTQAVLKARDLQRGVGPVGPGRP
jgi:DNA-binding NarL/FixJ family response regulator